MLKRTGSPALCQTKAAGKRSTTHVPRTDRHLQFTYKTISCRLFRTCVCCRKPRPSVSQQSTPEQPHPLVRSAVDATPPIMRPLGSIDMSQPSAHSQPGVSHLPATGWHNESTQPERTPVVEQQQPARHWNAEQQQPWNTARFDAAAESADADSGRQDDGLSGRPYGDQLTGNPSEPTGAAQFAPVQEAADQPTKRQLAQSIAPASVAPVAPTHAEKPVAAQQPKVAPAPAAKEAASNSNQDLGASQKAGWFSGIRKIFTRKRDPLEDDCEFYFDEKTGKWRQKGVAAEEEEAPLAPPPTFFGSATAQPSTDGSDASGAAAAPKPLNAINLSAVQRGPGGSVSMRNRYVDVFNTTGAPSSAAPAPTPAECHPLFRRRPPSICPTDRQTRALEQPSLPPT